jgi:hypothetical protein
MSRDNSVVTSFPEGHATGLFRDCEKEAGDVRGGESCDNLTHTSRKPIRTPIEILRS